MKIFQWAAPVPIYDEGLSYVQEDEWQNCDGYADLGIIVIAMSIK